MKKIIVVLIAVFALTAVASAQPRAIGIRGGGNGAEVSYQHSLGGNFLEFDLGLAQKAFGLTAIYDFNFYSVDNFNFYAGPGASIVLGNNIFVPGIVGQIGGEYQIQAIPLNISVDWTPGIFFANSSNFVAGNVALGIRYRF